jgi:hypothetical protein
VSENEDFLANQEINYDLKRLDNDSMCFGIVIKECYFSPAVSSFFSFLTRD